MRISRFLPLCFSATVLATAVAVGLGAYQSATMIVEDEEELKLSSLAREKVAEVTTYFNTIVEDLRVTAANPATADAVVAFGEAWAALDGDPTEIQQTLYITEKPHATGEKEALDDAGDGSAYSAAHARYHDAFRTLLRERGYYDIFLFDLDGNLIYTVFKELDYATNLVAGPYRDTGLCQAFQAARADVRAGAIHFFDFAPYAPSANAPASFISTPILDRAGTPLGVLVFQMPIDRLNETVGKTAGLGETGQAYAVGADRLMRTQARQERAPTLLAREVATNHVASALNGTAFVGHVTDYLGRDVLAAALPIQVQGTNWAVVIEQEASEALAATNRLASNVALTTLAALVVLTGVAVFVSRLVTRPLTGLNHAMIALADGDYDIAVPGDGRRDEIGEMAAAVAVFKQKGLENRQLVEAQQAQEAEAERARVDALRGMASTVEEQAVGMATVIGEKTDDMATASGRMRESASLVESRAGAVASAAEQSLANTNAVAAASEELTSSINEISGQIGTSATVAKQAAETAAKTQAIVGSLSEAARKVGDVVQLIADVAEQTNLLALNATIEAARAGDAGKGFAVVASEVKNLAGQTQRATGEIAGQVGEMQTITEQAVDAIKSIAAVIQDIDERSGGIAAAVEEQNAATGEIARNVGQAADAAREVAERILEVSREASELGDVAARVDGAAASVSETATVLKRDLVRIVRTAVPEVDRRHEHKPVPVDRRQG